MTRRRSLRTDVQGWAFLSPFVAGFAVFTLVPVVASLVLSFTKYDILSPPQWVGLKNYTDMLASNQFWTSWRLTVVYAVASVGLTMILGLLFALSIHKARRASGTWRVVYYLPAIISGAGEALMLTLIWDRNGLVNWLLSLFGITGPAWFQSSQSAMPALILSRYWTIGNIILLFLASRSSVPDELYEVADIDGASSWDSFRVITFPMMTPIVLFNLVLGILASLQIFTQVMILTEGGPAGATRLIGIHIYDLAFRDQRFGYASAVSWSLFIVAVLVSLVVMRTSGRWVHYQYDPRQGEAG